MFNFRNLTLLKSSTFNLKYKKSYIGTIISIGNVILTLKTINQYLSSIQYHLQFKACLIICFKEALLLSAFNYIPHYTNFINGSQSTETLSITKRYSVSLALYALVPLVLRFLTRLKHKVNHTSANPNSSIPPAM